MNNREKQTFTLEYVGHDTLTIFKEACKYSTSLKDLEIISVEETELPDSVLKKGYNIVLSASLEDMFWVGRFFERLDHLRTLELMRFKKSVKVQIPEQLLKLCDLLDVTPQLVIQGFTNDLALSVHDSSGSDERGLAVEYFQRCGHGSHLFDQEEIENIIDGLNWIRYEWGSFGNNREEDYKKFFKKELKEWYNKWNEEKKQKSTAV